MNDQYVVALIYTIEHGDMVDYQNACPLSYDQNPKFRLTVVNKIARFELKEHYTKEEGACEAVKPFISLWEFEVTFRHGPSLFSLRYLKPEIKIKGKAHHQLSPVRTSARLVQGFRQYPSPPPEFTVDPDDPDVKSMYDRYVNYRLGKRSGIGEPLPGLAYFCLTMLEYKFVGEKPSKRGATANAYRIDKAILCKIGDLTANKGDLSVLRKRDKACVIPLTENEEGFLEDAVKKIIWRAAQLAADDTQPLPKITDGRLHKPLEYRSSSPVPCHDDAAAGTANSAIRPAGAPSRPAGKAGGLMALGGVESDYN